MHPGHDQPGYGDAAFEPQADFAFDDTGNDEYENMQRNIASLNMFNTTHGTQPDFGPIHHPGGDASHHLHPEPLDNPIFFGQNAGITPASTSWAKVKSPRTLHAQSMQSEILDGRASSVAQQFGQITPPDDTPPKEFPAASNGEPPLSAKSERARNAANQRHAKAKRAKKEGAKGTKAQGANEDDDDDDGEGEVDGKREKYREKNRLAAAKCRAKKKTHTEDLEESARHITATNNRLRAEERELRDLFSSLRHQALAHDPTQGCTCSAIHMYNHNKAQEAARTAAMGLAGIGMGAPGPGIPSPSIGSDGSGLNSPRFASQPASRAQSFSTGYGGRTSSLGGQLGFLPPRTASDMRKQSYVANGIASPTGSGDDANEYQREIRGDSMDLR